MKKANAACKQSERFVSVFLHCHLSNDEVLRASALAEKSSQTYRLLVENPAHPLGLRVTHKSVIVFEEWSLPPREPDRIGGEESPKMEPDVHNQQSAADCKHSGVRR